MRAESLPLTQLPHVSRLYSHYLTDFSKVLPYYACPPLSRDWLQGSAAARAAYPTSRRKQVAAVLEAQNKGWNASPQALANVERLRSGACAVVTGQQVALFGGPLYAILKAITAIKLAEEATAAGVDSVPIFWLATEDHDLAEVAFANIPSTTHLQKITILPDVGEGSPVGGIVLDHEIATAVNTAAQWLGDSEVTDWLRDCYRPGGTLGNSFARLFTKLFADHGLILLDPANPELHEIAKPMFLQAADKAAELTQSLLRQNQRLESSGYHAQVKVTDSSTLLFVLEAGARTPVHRSNSHFSIGKGKLTVDELNARIDARPEDFSGNALFRPVVQDFLLPTLAYVGGPAEVAYFAQAAVVYEMMLGRVTPILPRISATLVEPKIARKLEQHKLVVPMSFLGEEVLTRTIATHSLPPELTSKFASAKATLETTLQSLDAALEKLDPTMKEAADRSGAKMRYQLNRLEQRAALAQQRRGQDIARHAHELSTALFPHKSLQEREVAGIYFVARYGFQLISDLKSRARAATSDHQLFYL
ncbi:MAG TPA: bacillithiol biosynthesis cysteine-adding enzyme BshC [Terriglobales bacterium]|nr:bacillithiol biosynthesis cysteine-adding enzyme BshC [Terriglobales bacterium]